MDNIFQCIVASTFAPNQQFVAERTPFILKEETVREVSKQINARRFSGAPIGFFLHPPKKSNQKQHDLALVTSLVADKNDIQHQRQNAKIGEFVSAEVQHDREYNIFKCVATLFLKDEEAIKTFSKKKHEIYPVMSYDIKDLSKSLVKIFSITKELDNGINSAASEAVSYLVPPITVLWCHVGLKRSSPNPYLGIL